MSFAILVIVWVQSEHDLSWAFVVIVWVQSEFDLLRVLGGNSLGATDNLTACMPRTQRTSARRWSERILSRECHARRMQDASERRASESCARECHASQTEDATGSGASGSCARECQASQTPDASDHSHESRASDARCERLISFSQDRNLTHDKLGADGTRSGVQASSAIKPRQQ